MRGIGLIPCSVLWYSVGHVLFSPALYLCLSAVNDLSVGDCPGKITINYAFTFYALILSTWEIFADLLSSFTYISLHSFTDFYLPKLQRSSQFPPSPLDTKFSVDSSAKSIKTEAA